MEQAGQQILDAAQAVKLAPQLTIATHGLLATRQILLPAFG